MAILEILSNGSYLSIQKHMLTPLHSAIFSKVLLVPYTLGYSINLYGILVIRKVLHEGVSPNTVMNSSQWHWRILGGQEGAMPIQK